MGHIPTQPTRLARPCPTGRPKARPGSPVRARPIHGLVMTHPNPAGLGRAGAGRRVGFKLCVYVVHIWLPPLAAARLGGLRGSVVDYVSIYGLVILLYNKLT